MELSYLHGFDNRLNNNMSPLRGVSENRWGVNKGAKMASIILTILYVTLFCSLYVFCTHEFIKY